MRRKNTRSSSKSTPDSKNETKRSSRSSRRKRSRSRSQDSEEENTSIASSNVTGDTKESAEDGKKEILSNSSEKEVKDVNDTNNLVENENMYDTNNDNASEGSHTPPPAGFIGNEVPESDEVDAEKGKSKGINNSQVEENSVIKMNSVTYGSPEEATTNNEVCPEIDLSHKDKSKDYSVIEDQQTDKCSKDMCTVDVSTEEHCDVDLNKTEVDSVQCSSVNEGEPEKNISENNKVETEKLNDAEADDDQAEEGEIRESKSDEENESYGHLPHLNKVKKPPVKIKLRRDSFFEAIEKLRDSENTEVKKMKWDPEEHKCLKLSYSDLFQLHVNDFKALSSDLKLADENEIKLEDTYKHKAADIKERTISMDSSSEEIGKPEYTKQLSRVSSDDQESTNIIALNRKISIVDDTASKLRPPPSPAKEPVSSILYISNLVRPFTIKQLKGLLERTGSIKEDGFWTDRIKSKCYVEYESTEEAEATRNALHGVNWPIGNGKKLVIEYSTEEEMEKAKNPPAPKVAPPPPQPAPPRAKTPQKENEEPVNDPRNGDRRDERKRRDSERDRDRGRTTLAREWDVGKGSHKNRSRSRSRERRRKHSRRSITPLEDFIARKQRKLEESVPQKLMDDLFQRTKSMPCIYWQPLSPEEISVKQQQRLSRMEEHKRRMEENSRNRGAREPGRGAYRRRFD